MISQSAIKKARKANLNVYIYPGLMDHNPHFEERYGRGYLIYEEIKMLWAIIHIDRDIPFEMLTSKSRKAEHVRPRQIYAYFMCHYSGRSLKYIGEWLGGVDHATIINSRTTISDMIYTEKPFKAEILRLDKKVMETFGFKESLLKL